MVFAKESITYHALCVCKLISHRRTHNPCIALALLVRGRDHAHELTCEAFSGTLGANNIQLYTKTTSEEPRATS